MTGLRWLERVALACLDDSVLVVCGFGALALAVALWVCR